MTGREYVLSRYPQAKAWRVPAPDLLSGGWAWRIVDVGESRREWPGAADEDAAWEVAARELRGEG